MVTEFTKNVELLALRESTYSLYVFKEVGTNELIMCTLLPNWKVPQITIGEIGFIKYLKVNAGDEYITPEGEKVIYKYTNTYFLDYIQRSTKSKNMEIIL